MASSGIDLSSLLSVLGNGSSGIDVSTAVAGAIYAARGPERQWQAQQSTLAFQTSALNRLNGLASTLSDSLNSLGDPVSALTAMAANSSNSSIVTASAASGTAAGNHVVMVNNLAATASWYSDAVATSSTTLAAGNFTIAVGGGTGTTIQIGSGVNTLDQLAASINGKNLGVTASVVNDAAGSRLAIVSNTSGASGDISITQTSGLAFTQATIGKNASLTVDGIPISSATNTVTGAVSGVTFNLVGAAPGTQVNVNVAPDQSQITDAINTFVSAYNSLVQNLSAQFTYNTSTQSAGPLAADSSVRSLQSELLNAISYTSTGTSGLTTLGSLGISMEDDGTLSVDDSKLSSALQSNFGVVQNFFQGTTSNGFAKSLNTILNTYTDPSQGAFTVDLQSINNENQDLQDQIDRFELYITNEQSRLTTMYSNAEIALQQLPNQMNQINALLGYNTKNS